MKRLIFGEHDETPMTGGLAQKRMIIWCSTCLPAGRSDRKIIPTEVGKLN
jgi:hypothetical protein